MLVRLSTLALAASLLSTSPSPVTGLSAADIPSDTPISALLTSAQSHLSRGETNDALVYYDAAIARDPNNYLTLFKRATTYLSMGRTTQATEDFNKVLEIKPGFEGAHAQLGRIKARGGDWDGAKQQYLLARRDDDLAALEEAKGASTLADAAAKSGKWEECAAQAGEAILVASRSLPLRQLRARCNFESGHAVRGIADLQHVLQMKPGDTSPHVKISAIMFYALGDTQEGMAAIRKCLHSDPESKLCKKLLKQEKAIDKALQRITKALEKNQPTTAVRQLVPTSDDDGLIKEVKDQVKLLREDGTIPSAVNDVLVARLVGMACQAYYEVSLALLITHLLAADSTGSPGVRKPRNTAVNHSLSMRIPFTPFFTRARLNLTRKNSTPLSIASRRPRKPRPKANVAWQTNFCATLKLL